MADFHQFKSGRQFGAWLGIVPRQSSSGGKASLGRITKRGDDYLRTLLIQGAKSAVMSVDKRDDPTSRWLKQLIERMGWQKACVALAIKNARACTGSRTGRSLSPKRRFAAIQNPFNPNNTLESSHPKTCSRRCLTGQTGSW